MLYLIGQIVLCLLFTALVGVAVGWLLRGLGTARQTDLVEARWRARLTQLQQQRDESATAAPPAATVPVEAPARPQSAELQALEQRLAERERELAALRTAQAVRQQQPDENLITRLRESQQLSQQLQGHLADQRAASSQISHQLELAQTERETLVMRLRDNETEIGRLNKERQHAIATVAGLQKELRSLRAAVARGTATVSSPAVTVEPTAGKHAGQQAPVAGAAGASAPQPPASTASVTAPPPVSAKATPSSSLPSRPQRDLPIGDSATDTAGYQPQWRLRAPNGKADDLQAIYGIGPKLERQLNELGIFHFRQIAAFGRHDIVWVAQRLRAFPGRILRDRWVEQARSLATRPDNQ